MAVEEIDCLSFPIHDRRFCRRRQDPEPALQFGALVLRSDSPGHVDKSNVGRLGWLHPYALK